MNCHSCGNEFIKVHHNVCRDCRNVDQRRRYSKRRGSSYKTRGPHKSTREIHNQKGARLYQTWTDMKQRCINPNHKSFKNYGGRGISVCDSWLNSFTAFQKWALENGYKNNLQIDRINNDQGYYPNNCKWSTHSENASNTRRNRFVEIDGQILTLSQVSRKYKIPKPTLRQRLNAGLSPEDAVSRQKIKGKRLL